MMIRELVGKVVGARVPASWVRYFSPARLLLDLNAWWVGLLGAYLIRNSLTNEGLKASTFGATLALALIAQTAVGYLFGVYFGRWRYSSFEEMAGLARTTFVAALLMVGARKFFNLGVQDNVIALGSLFALFTMAAVRYLYRLVIAYRRRPADVANLTRLLVVGAGDRGCGIVNDILMSKNSPYIPVGFVDDDPSRRRLIVNGVKVLGEHKTIAAAAMETGATALLVALPAVSPDAMAVILHQAEIANPPLKVKVLSPLDSLFGERTNAALIRDLSDEDLLGRHRVETDVESIAQYIRGKRVLVTGAGGSIGSELCRQLARFSPERLVMLDRDESGLHGVELSISGTALLDSPDLVLADLRDRERIFEVLRDIKPHVVFHAAALKHLPLLERHPGEALKSNVWGTLTMLEASMAVGVERFVNISTDKAADPINVLGYSKRVAERLTAWAAETTETGTYVSVRFGNVLGSRGSVLTTFKNQIAEGQPITVTDKDVTRYFMLVSEAVQLVIQAGAVGDPGEVLVLDMGEPVRIAEVAAALVRRSGKDIPIRYTGLRAGEKMHEALLGSDEVDTRPKHPLISQVPVPPLSPLKVTDLDADAESVIVLSVLSRLCQIDTPTEFNVENVL